MAGVCKKCGGQTTNTRAASPSGECFNCQHGLKRDPPQPLPETHLPYASASEIRLTCTCGWDTVVCANWEEAGRHYDMHLANDFT